MEMTDITAKPFDWNDNLSKEALEDFEGIRKDLPYCTCQNIGMALAKLELLEKQGQEPKTGHWIEDAETYYKAINERGCEPYENTPIFLDDIACSECLAKFSVIDNETQRFKCCPNCGAKMESEDQA